MIYNVAYIGNMVQTAEYIFYNNKMNLNMVICEENKITNELITFCLTRNVQLEIITDKKSLITIFSKNKHMIDFYIMCSFGMIIPQECIDISKIYNIHYSELPKYKGRHPLYWATVNNEKYMGISVHEVECNIDSGKIIWQELEPYYFWMDNISITEKLTEKIPLLIENILKYIEGKLGFIKNSLGNYYQIVSDDDKTINLDIDSPDVIFNKIRAQASYRGAKLKYDDTIYWIKKIEFAFLPSNRKDTVSIKYNDKIWINLIEFDTEKV